VINKRIENAKKEILAVSEYDFTILNDRVEDATKEFIIIAKAARLKQDEKDQAAFVSRWLSH